MITCNFNYLNRPGCGVLVHYGEFWYPVRVIKREGPKSWHVQWWRGCQFASGTIEPGSSATVSLDNIVDSLWLKRAERQKIQVSKVNMYWLKADAH